MFLHKKIIENISAPVGPNLTRHCMNYKIKTPFQTTLWFGPVKILLRKDISKTFTLLHSVYWQPNINVF